MASSILYVHVIWNQRQRSTIMWCHLFQKERRTLLNDIKKIDENIKTDDKNDLDQGNGSYRYEASKIILLSTIKFFMYNKRFDLPLFLFAFYLR